MSLRLTQRDENLAGRPAKSLPEGAVENSPGNAERSPGMARRKSMSPVGAAEPQKVALDCVSVQGRRRWVSRCDTNSPVSPRKCDKTGARYS